MDCFFCIPILFGCQTKIKPEGDQTPRICPRCNNAAVVGAKSSKWFEFCFVPIVPMSSKHVWTCNICQWRLPMQQGWEPAVANNMMYPSGGPGYPPNTPGWHQAPNQPGYQPAYLGQAPQK